MMMSFEGISAHLDVHHNVWIYKKQDKSRHAQSAFIIAAKIPPLCHSEGEARRILLGSKSNMERKILRYAQNDKARLFRSNDQKSTLPRLWGI